MTKKSKFKKLLVLVIVLVAISVSVLIVNAAQTDEQVNDTQKQIEVTAETNTDSNISTYFHEASGTLIVSGEGKVSGLYGRKYEDTNLGEIDGMPPNEYLPTGIIKVDDSVKHLIIEEGITGIQNSFNDLRILETVSFPESLNWVADSFLDCYKLSNMILPKNITKVSYSFRECNNLSEVVLPQNISLVEESFEKCEKVTSVEFLGDSVQIVGGFCYLAIEELYIPANSVVKKAAFSFCEKLEKVVLGSGVELCNTFEYPSGEVETFIPCFYGRNENMVIVADQNKAENYRDAYDTNYIYDYDDFTFAYHSTVPEKITTTIEYDGIKLDWDAKYYADTYNIYRKANGESKWTKIADTRANSYLDKTAKSGKTYTYMLKTDDNSESVTVEASYIAPPELLSAYNTTTNTVRLKWNKVGGAVKYRVYRSSYIYGEGFSKWEKLADVTTTEFVDKSIVNGQGYRYTVRAFGKIHYSDYDKEGVYTTALSMPKITSISNTTKGVKIVVDNDMGMCYIYRKTTGGKWENVGFTNGVTYIDKTAQSGTTYTYTVRCVSYLNSSVSLSAYDTKGKTIKHLETPELSSATSTKAGVKLEWDKVTGASGYKVYRKTGNSGWGEAIATVKGNSTVTYLDKTAKKGVTYTYTVRAYNGTTKSGYIASGKTVTDKY